MINFDGSHYDSLGKVPEKNLSIFSGIPLHTEILMCSKAGILFWEDHYFMLMATLRKSRVNIPMNYTMEYFQEQINELTLHLFPFNFIGLHLPICLNPLRIFVFL